jgi:hypothetical protein
VTSDERSWLLSLGIMALLIWASLGFTSQLDWLATW